MNRILTLFSIAAFSFSAIASSDTDEWQDDWQDSQSNWIPITGFAELAYGDWLTNNSLLPISSSLSEARLRLETGYDNDSFTVNLKSDVLYDFTLSTADFNLREAFFAGNLSDLLSQTALDSAPQLNNVAIKAGRQILSWGTGDFLFVNDLFAKDWQSFFNGRADQYLKAPADAIKISYFGDEVNVDFVWQPQFGSDNYINGQRFSFYNPQLDKIFVPERAITANEPNNSTFSARLYFSYDNADIAFYANKTFAGVPSSAPTMMSDSTTSNLFYFPELSSIGTSVISPLASGLVKFETAYYHYDSDDANAPSNQTRILLGYEQEILARFNFSTQFYLEHNHQISKSTNKSTRQVLTTSLRYRSQDDRWITSLFGFYSPNQDDSYWRPSLQYRYSDQWTIALGANIFTGKPARFFGQFDLNDNAYLRLDYFF